MLVFWPGRSFASLQTRQHCPVMHQEFSLAGFEATFQRRATTAAPFASISVTSSIGLATFAARVSAFGRMIRMTVSVPGQPGSAQMISETVTATASRRAGSSSAISRTQFLIRAAATGSRGFCARPATASTCSPPGSERMQPLHPLCRTAACRHSRSRQGSSPLLPQSACGPAVQSIGEAAEQDEAILIADRKHEGLGMESDR